MTIQAEIGSEFWSVPIKQNVNLVFPMQTQWYISGRGALHAIIRELTDRHTVAMPSWCCDSMIKPFTDAGFNVRFYPVYWQDSLVQEISLDCDVLFLMDYFGYTSAAPDLSGYSGIVIRDVTHSIFSSSCCDADYYFGSLRKWCGVWTGGYAWTKDGHGLSCEQGDDLGYITLREQAMQLKNCYINRYPDSNGRLVTDKRYLRLFGEAEEKLDMLGCQPAAERDVSLARFLNEDVIRARRRENARVLMDAFPDWLIFKELNESDCPLFVPVFVPEGRRNDLRKYLIQNEIYCPVHWPVSTYHKLTEREQYLYENELSLVCDQRYSKEDMDRTVTLIRMYWEEHSSAHSFYT